MLRETTSCPSRTGTCERGEGYSLLLFITAITNTKLCASGEEEVEGMCYEIRRAEACVD